MTSSLYLLLSVQDGLVVTDVVTEPDDEDEMRLDPVWGRPRHWYRVFSFLKKVLRSYFVRFKYKTKYFRLRLS